MTQRSPIIAWLLLAATVAVFAVSVSWLATAGSDASANSLVTWGVHIGNTLQALVLYDAIATACVSIVVIWAAFESRWRLGRWLAIVDTVAIAAAPPAAFEILPATSTAGYFGGQALLVALTLWIVRQFERFQRSEGSQPTDRWKFSMFDLLALTTGVAVVLGLLNRGDVLHSGWMKVFAPSIACNAALAVAAVLLKAYQRAFLNRVVILTSVALVLGIALSFAPNRQAGDEMAGNLIQVILLIAWIELGGIVKHDLNIDDASMDTKGSDHTV
jgi:hypothetical protein